ncbi:hypothetical protein CIK67_17595 [Brachybacterium alimentarium]|nr:hypothetical protein CIK67_17595 [Brachybacterium alimentarium]
MLPSSRPASPLAPSPRHPVTPSPRHPVTPSPRHPVTPSPRVAEFCGRTTDVRDDIGRVMSQDFGDSSVSGHR